MGDRVQICLIGSGVVGSFIGAWACGISTGNPLPVIAWFAVAIAFVAAGA